MRVLVRGFLAVLWLGVAAAWGCGDRRASREEPPRRLDVSVFADTGHVERLRIVPPEIQAPESAAVWLAQVTPTRPPPISAPLPDAMPSPVEEAPPSPPPLEVDPDLKPPILKSPPPLRIPARAPRGWVELDVRVGEDGLVTDALWAGGSEDSSLTEAATECAFAMRFFPALRAGHPTAVWTRQRFDFAARRRSR